MENKKLKIIGRILSFPVLKIAIGIILINVGLFIMRSLTQLILSSFHINNDLIQSSSIFVVKIIGLYYLYRLFIWIYEKRKPSEIACKKNTLKQIFLGSLTGLLCIGFITGVNLLYFRKHKVTK